MTGGEIGSSGISRQEFGAYFRARAGSIVWSRRNAKLSLWTYAAINASPELINKITLTAGTQG